MRRWLAGCALVAGLASGAGAQDGTAPAEPVPARQLTLDIQQRGIADVLEHFRLRTGKDIRLAPDMEARLHREPVLITAQFENRWWEDALRRVAASVQARVVRDGDVWFVTGDPATTTETVQDLPPGDQGRPVHVVRATEVRQAFTELIASVSIPIVAVIGGFAMLACQLLALAMFPAFLLRAREVGERRSVMAFAVGVPNVIGGALVLTIAGALGPVGILPATILLIAAFGVLVVGLAGRAQALGARLLGPERAAGRLAPLALGWTVMFGVALVPFVGWVVFGWWAVSSFGITMLAMIKSLGAAPPPGRGPAAAVRA